MNRLMYRELARGSGYSGIRESSRARVAIRAYTRENLLDTCVLAIRVVRCVYSARLSRANKGVTVPRIEASIAECYHCCTPFAPNLVEHLDSPLPDKRIYLCDTCWDSPDGYREHGDKFLGRVTLVPIGGKC